MSLSSRVTSPSFYKPREPTTPVPRTPGGRRPHHAQQSRVCESWLCTSNLSESSHRTPTFCLMPPEGDRHPQDPSSRGATQASGLRKWPPQQQEPQPPELRGGGEMVASTCAFLNTRPSPGFSRLPGRTQTPRVLWGFASAPQPSPAGVPAQSSPSIPGRVLGREPRPGWLFARSPRSSHSRSASALFLSLRTLSQGIAQASCSGPSRAQSRGPAHTPGQACPCPSRSGHPAPSLPTPTPRSSRPRGRRPREAAGGAAAPPAGGWSDTPERAVSPPEVLNFTLGGFSCRVGDANS